VERWDVALSPQLLNTVVMAPESLSISGLWGYIHYLADQGLNNGRYWLAFWVKVLQPLVTAALVLMAISFIFGPLRSVTLGQRVFTGVLVGFTFRIAQDLLGPSSLVFGFSPLFAVLVPAGICALAGCGCCVAPVDGGGVPGFWSKRPCRKTGAFLWPSDLRT
jgi:lipopolysaccharide export system permease protein